MVARATPLPDRDRTFTLQGRDGATHVFVSAEKLGGPSRTRLVTRVVEDSDTVVIVNCGELCNEELGEIVDVSNVAA